MNKPSVYIIIPEFEANAIPSFMLTIILLSKNEYVVLLSLLKLNFSFPFINIIESPTCVKAAYTAVSLLTIFSIFTVVSSSLGPNTSTRVKS